MSREDWPSREQMNPAPSPADVTLAAAYILQFLREEGDSNLHNRWRRFKQWVWAKQGIQGYTKPDLRPWEEQRKMARWEIAAAEAMQRLIAAGSVVKASDSQEAVGTVRITMRDQRGSNSTSFDEFKVVVPGQFRLSSRAAREPDREFIYDPDLYLARIEIEGAHPRVRRAIHEAVEAFRLEVYLAAATMLGSASEGAWLQLFEAFGEWAEAHGRKAPSVDPDKLAKPVLNAEATFNRIPEFQERRKNARLGSLTIKGLVLHYDHLREVRNFAAHFDTSERFDLTLPAVAVLLLKSANYFSTIYRLRAALSSSRPSQINPPEPAS